MQALTASELLASAFRLLSVETRARMVALLKSGPLCVGGLARKLGVTPAAVSQHLKLMRSAGLVTSARRGYYVHYELNPEAFRRLRGLADHFFDVQPPQGGSQGRCCQSTCCREGCPSDSEEGSGTG
jgi:DNA-binding transcriptional ArsR family regulator